MCECIGRRDISIGGEGPECVVRGGCEFMGRGRECIGEEWERVGVYGRYVEGGRV